MEIIRELFYCNILTNYSIHYKFDADSFECYYKSTNDIFWKTIYRNTKQKDTNIAWE